MTFSLSLRRALAMAAVVILGSGANVVPVEDYREKEAFVVCRAAPEPSCVAQHWLVDSPGVRPDASQRATRPPQAPDSYG